MNRTDYILTLTKGILEAPEEIVSYLLDYVGSIYELSEVQKTGAVSLAAGLGNGKDVSFTDWVKILRREKVKKCRVRSVTEASDKLPAHIAAAFSGTQEYLLEVVTEKTARCYSIKTFYSPSYAITTELFSALTDAQTNSEALWQQVAKQITESNEMNARKAVEKNAVREYLNSREGKDVFNFLASNLSEEMQIECVVSETPFIIPEYLKDLFYQSESLFFADDDREIAFLYALTDCTPEQLIKLVNAQPFTQALWPACEADLNEYPLPESPVLTAVEIEAYIKKQTTEALNANGLVSVVCGVIRKLAEENHMRPVIPQELKAVFGPDKKDYDNALARGRSKDRWYLKSNEQPWEVCYFEPLQITTLLAPKDDLQKAKAAFTHALEEIENFAKKIQSPFEEAFRLAHYFLTGTVPAGNYDEQHLESIANDLITKGFSERAVEVLKNNFPYAQDWHKMQFDTETILGLFAVNNANHFGGMGSWNDQYMEEDPETYERVSAQAFAAMKNYFVALLSK